MCGGRERLPPPPGPSAASQLNPLPFGVLVTRRMLINARSPEELRLALVSDKTLDDYQVEVADHGLLRGNIYRGTIAAVQPSLNAAFIEFGGERHGFLSVKDVVAQAFYRQPADPRRPRIEEVLERGKLIVVQVAKESEGDKGAVLTTNLSLAGRFLVFTPFDDMRGVSRKVEDEDDRARLKEMVRGLDIPEGGGVIVRTNGLGQTKAALQRDLAALLRLWKRVSAEARQGKETKLLYSDQDLIFRALRDYLDSSITEILVDDEQVFQRAGRYLEALVPRNRPQLIHDRERAPLFGRHGIEEQIDSIFRRTVPLKSGGSLVIDRTEALTAIDVNSGRSTRASSQEETALATNMEAAPEIARQLRLRDLGGLLVVDFIDMRATRHQRKVEKEMRDALKPDKARATVGRISANGLLEINRQRISQTLAVRTLRACPTCGGAGQVPSPERMGLDLLRRIEARVAENGGRSGKIVVRLHPELAHALQNARRRELATLEEELRVAVEIVADPSIDYADAPVDWTADPRGGARAAGREAPEAAVQASQLAVPGTDEPAAPSGRKRPAAKRPVGRKRPPAAEAAPAEKEKEAAGGDQESGSRPRSRPGRRRRRRKSTGPKAPSAS